MDRAVAAARTAFDDGPVAAADATRSAPSTSTRCREGLIAPRRRPRRHLAAPVGRAPQDRQVVRRGRRGHVRLLRRPGRHASRSRSGPRRRPAASFGLLVREPVGVVGAIIPWNAPLGLIANKVAPGAARGLHGRAEGVARGARRGATSWPRSPSRSGCRRACSTSSPPTARCPSCSCATRASTRSPSPARPRPGGASRRSAASASRAARSSSAASRPRWSSTTSTSASRRRRSPRAECFLSGQVCSSLTRDHRLPVAPRRAGRGARRADGRRSTVGDPFDGGDADGPARRRAPARPRPRLHREGRRGGRDARGRRRPARGPRARAGSSSRRCSATSTTGSTIAQEEIFGPVLSVIPADDEEHAVELANDTIYGLNASVFTHDVDRARDVAGQLRSGHRRPQRVPHRLRHRVRRLQAVGHRPRGRDRGPAAVPRDQDRHPRGHAQRLLS